MQPTYSICVAVALTACMPTTRCLAQKTGARPAYKLLRFDEDWSAFDPEQGDDFFDPIKHIKLNESGSVWTSIGGDLRFRAEGWENFAFSEPNDDAFVLGRFFLHADFHAGEHVRAFVRGKSAFMPGDRDLPGGKRALDVDSLALQDAFFDLIVPIDDDVTLTARIGRQEFLFGKQRLVSPLPWSNTQRTWDAARIIVDYRGWRIDGFLSRFVPVQKYDPNDWEPGIDFFGVYAAGTVGQGDNAPKLDLYAFGYQREAAVFNGSVGDEDRYTVGARIVGKIGAESVDYDIEGAYQFGEVGSADISAYMFAAQIGYAMTIDDVKIRPFIGFDYASGDDSPSDGNVETFNQLFPLGHAYYGFMDFVGRQNAVDLSAGVSIAPTSDLTIVVTGHAFWRASKADALYNAGGGVVRAGALSNDREIGQEIDLIVRYSLDAHTTLEGGYSHFFPGGFLSESGSADDMDWIYLQIAYRF